MEIRKGIPVSRGYAIGKAFVLDTEEFRIPKRTIPSAGVAAEIERLHKAAQTAAHDLRKQLTKVSKKVGETATKIVEAHMTLLADEHLREEIIETIRKSRTNAEYAVSRTIRRKLKILEDGENISFAARLRETFLECEKAYLRALLGAKREDISHLTEPVVIVAQDLSPAQTIAFDRDKILGILTDRGGQTSHTSIIADSLGIPAVVALNTITTDVSGGDRIIIDGEIGTVIIDPDEGTIKLYEAMARNRAILGQRLAKELQNLPIETKDGHKIELMANIELPDEIQGAIKNGAEGIGLYRTEFLYLSNNFNPTEQHHLEAYRKAIQFLGNRKLIVRTMDLGADKMPLDGLAAESNPFLGIRGIRLCFERPDLFRVQLRAILKVADHGNVGIMLPMVSSLSELLQAREILDQVGREMRLPLRTVPLGIMIEVPSAAMICDLLAKHVDFFSIGTNDLIAYTIAVDRLHEKMAPLYQPAHPAILRLLKQIIETGARFGKPVSVCGEMSSDINYTVLLLGLGLKCFSVVPPALPEVKKLIRSVTLEDAQVIAAKALTFEDARTTHEFLREETRKILPDVF